MKKIYAITLITAAVLIGIGIYWYTRPELRMNKHVFESTGNISIPMEDRPELFKQILINIDKDVCAKMKNYRQALVDNATPENAYLYIYEPSDKRYKVEIEYSGVAVFTGEISEAAQEDWREFGLTMFTMCNSEVK